MPAANAAAGDIWVNASFSASASAGNQRPMAVHEIGHAVFGLNDVTTNLGLHGASLPPSVNDLLHTVMSYSAASGVSPGQPYTQSQGGFSSTRQTMPMVLDILAAQHIYGRNSNYHSGDDIYSFNTSTSYFMTIWDAGGINTFDVSKLNRNTFLDLRQGEYSDVGSVVDVFFIPGSTIPPTSFNKTVGIAYGVIIQNAVGGSGSDTIVGNAANNHFRGNIGNDTLSGAAGVDTAAYSVQANAATISRSGSQIIITTPQDGTDTLLDVERLAFTDQIVAFDVAGNAGQAYRLYQAAFGRKPDREGLSYWIDRMDDGFGLAQVAANFIQLREFSAKYGDFSIMPNEQFLRVMYQNVLGREPDASGLDFWSRQLSAGAQRQAVLTSFSESAENQTNVAPALLNGISLDLLPFT